MLLRRVTQHVRDQNWTAVAIDFCIVVVGVFVGIQVASWNDARVAKQDLIKNLDQLSAEAEQNVKIAAGMMRWIDHGQNDRDLLWKAIIDCSPSPEALGVFSDVMLEFTESFQSVFIDISLQRLARQDRFLNFLSADFTDAITQYAYRLERDNVILAGHYDRFWQTHITKHSAVSGGLDDSGAEVLPLARPFEEICKDPTFLNRFSATWGWLGGIYERNQRFQQASQEFISSVRGQRELLTNARN